jgi:hypothetical protein
MERGKLCTTSKIKGFWLESQVTSKPHITSLFRRKRRIISQAPIAMADIEYLKGLEAVRERAHLVLGAAERNELSHFDYDSSKMPAVAKFVAGVISVSS